MGARERTRGHNWERRIVQWINGLLPHGSGEAKRNLSETRDGASGDVHVALTSSPLRFLIEAKHRKVLQWPAMQRQADGAVTSPSDLAIGVGRLEGGEVMVTMRPKTFALFMLVTEALSFDNPDELHRLRGVVDVADNQL